MKTRIMRLLTALAVVFTFIGSVVSVSMPFSMLTANGEGIYDSDVLTNYAYEVADIVNRERAANGLSPLK